MRRSIVPIALLVVATLAACAREGNTGSEEALGTIRGAVLLAPTCPVESTESPCPGRPLAGVPVRVEDLEGVVRARTVSAEDGTFVIDVDAGTYVLTASIQDDPARSVAPIRVSVRAGEVVHSDVLVDSGIR